MQKNVSPDTDDRPLPRAATDDPHAPCGRTGGGFGLALLATLAILALYLFGASQASLWDRDEPRFCRATMEMIESGNYLYPTFNGELRPDKPILIYWLMSIPIRLLGPTELACRLWSAVGVASACLITWWMGRKLFPHDGRVGLWAMIILGLSPLPMAIGKLATADGILLPCMTGGAACIVGMLIDGPRLRHFLLLCVATGLALLAKGPLGLVPLGVAAVALALAGKVVPRRRWILPVVLGATLIGVTAFCVWGIAANNATDGEFYRLGVGKHVVGRSTRPLENHGGNFFLFLPFYLPVIAVGFFPWLALLPSAVSAMAAGRLGGEGRTRRTAAVLIAMSVPIFVVMTLVATKLPHYIISMWPALALAVAGAIRLVGRGEAEARDLRWLRRGAWIVGPLGVVGALAAAIAPFFLPLPALRLPMLGVAAVLLAMSLEQMKLLLQGRAGQAAVMMAVGIIAMDLVLHVMALPAIEEAKVAPRLARTVNAVAPDAPVAALGYNEPTLNFYFRRPIQSLNKATGKEIMAWVAEHPGGVLVTTTDRLAALEKVRGPLPAERIASVASVNLTRNLEPFELVALRIQPASE